MDIVEAVFPVLIGAALVAVLAVLFTGIVSMFRGGEFNRKYGNKLMRWRVALQALAVLLIVVFVFFVKS
jgi:hypothetical protein